MKTMLITGVFGFLGSHLAEKHEKRYSVLPGITLPWVVSGTHKLSFKEWMELDAEYTENKSGLTDLKIAVHTAGMILCNLFR